MFVEKCIMYHTSIVLLHLSYNIVHTILYRFDIAEIDTFHLILVKCKYV
jgi:hypothetical protein